MPYNGCVKERKKLRKIIEIPITFNDSNKTRIEIKTVNTPQHQVILDFLDE